MTSQRVERNWIRTGGYGRFRGEWVNVPNLHVNSSEQTIEDKLFVYRKKHEKWFQLLERKELSITTIKGG